jgi:transcriptional regulator with GAF, ATPase, and Fis domain
LLNCAALSETLLESELFGHEKGAFTGAHASKAGLLESTAGGTVFLDEIGELALGTQAKLLRVLEERSVLRVGATKPRRIDVRFVTATNRDLTREVRAGRFRGDLYYRISGLVVRIPPLRDRLSEIEPLALHFLAEFCEQLGQPVPELTASAIAALQSYEWPGNVRELKNVMERAVLLSGSAPITQEHVLSEPAPSDEELFERRGSGSESDDFGEPTQVISRPKPKEAPSPTQRRRARPLSCSRRIPFGFAVWGGVWMNDTVASLPRESEQEWLDAEAALSPFKANEWRRLTPAERLQRAWRLRQRLVNPREIHDRKLFPAP